VNKGTPLTVQILATGTNGLPLSYRFSTPAEMGNTGYTSKPGSSATLSATGCGTSRSRLL